MTSSLLNRHYLLSSYAFLRILRLYGVLWDRDPLSIVSIGTHQVQASIAFLSGTISGISSLILSGFKQALLSSHSAPVQVYCVASPQQRAVCRQAASSSASSSSTSAAQRSTRYAPRIMHSRSMVRAPWPAGVTGLFQAVGWPTTSGRSYSGCAGGCGRTPPRPQPPSIRRVALSHRRTAKAHRLPDISFWAWDCRGARSL